MTKDLSIESLIEQRDIHKIRSILYAQNEPNLLTEHRQNLANSKLKSDVKKTSSFVKRVKLVNSETLESLLKDAQKYNLSRYMTELFDVFIESPPKMKDIPSAICLISEINKNYESFGVDLCDKLSSNVLLGEKCSFPENLTIYARLFFELFFIRVISPPENVEMLMKILTKLNDLKFHKTFLMILRNFTSFFFGSDSESILQPDIKSKIQDIFFDFHDKVKIQLIKEHKFLVNKKNSNSEEVLNRGDLSTKSLEVTEQKENLVANLKDLDLKISKLLNAKSVSFEELGFDQEGNENDLASKSISLWDHRSPGGAGSSLSPDSHEAMVFLYGNEELRAFYQDLPSLSTLLSVEVLKELETKRKAASSEKSSNSAEKSSSDAASNVGIDNRRGLRNTSKGNLDQALDLFGLKKSSPQPPPPNPASLPVQSLPPKPKVNVESEKQHLKKLKAIDLETIDLADEQDLEHSEGFDSSRDHTELYENKKLAQEENALLNTLPDRMSAELCDEFCLAFCTMYAKSLKRDEFRQSLLFNLRYVPFNRNVLIPFYARIVASLSHFFAGLVRQLLSALFSQLKSLLKNNNYKIENHKVESKVRVARYVGEFVKFKCINLNQLFPVEKIFFVFNFCLKRFQGSNITFGCELIDSCGKFLNRNQGTKESFVEIVDKLKTLEKEKVLTNNQRMMLSSSLSSSLSKDDSIKPLFSKVKTKEQRFLEDLLLHRIDYFNEDELLNKMLCLPWKAKDTDAKNAFLKVFLSVDKCRIESISIFARLLKKLLEYYPDVVAILITSLLDSLHNGEDSNNHQKVLSQATFLAEIVNAKVMNVDCIEVLLNLLLVQPPTKLNLNIACHVLNAIQINVCCNRRQKLVFLQLFKTLHKVWIESDFLNLSESIAKLRKKFHKESVATPVKFKLITKRSSNIQNTPLKEHQSSEESEESETETDDEDLDDDDEEEEEELSDENEVDSDFERHLDQQFENDFQNLMSFSVDDLKMNQKATGVSTENMAIPLHVLGGNRIADSDVSKINPQNADANADTSSRLQDGVKFRVVKRDQKGRVDFRELMLPIGSAIVKQSAKDVESVRKDKKEMKDFVLSYEERERRNPTKASFSASLEDLFKSQDSD